MEFYPPTGTYDDLLSILARRELQRNKELLPRKGALAHAAVELPLNIIGSLLCLVARRMPPERMLAVQDRVYQALSGGERDPFDPASPALDRAAELLKESANIAGQDPAMVCLLSHPPVMGELAHLNIELVRHAFWALRRLRGRPCRPKVVIAVDRFALDTLPIHKEAVYAGFMGSYHLGTDRLVHSRNWASRGALKSSSWCSAAARIRRELHAGGEMAMVLGGGVPTTARVLYCAREYLGRLRRRRAGGGSAEALKRLEARMPDFVRFCRSGEVGAGLKKNAWRMMEAWLIDILTRAGALPRTDIGEVSGDVLEALSALAGALGCPEGSVPAELEAFKEEFSRQTPYRERLFRFLIQRVAPRGRPLLLIPLVHGRGGKIKIEIREAAAVLGPGSGGTGVRLLSRRGGRFLEEEVSVEDFCRNFVRAHYD